jgi:hypothetical protein
MDGSFLLWWWALCGVIIHIVLCNRMKTWCGTPIWEEVTTWMMFFPAMIAGPLLAAIELLENHQRGHP